MTGDNNYYNVFEYSQQNFTLVQIIETQAGIEIYPLSISFDPDDLSYLLITKRTEAGNSNRAEILKGIQLDDGGILVQNNILAPERKLEFLGDSITCGYGILSLSPNDPRCSDPQGIIEDNWLTYGPLTSRYLKGILSTSYSRIFVPFEKN